MWVDFAVVAGRGALMGDGVDGALEAIVLRPGFGRVGDLAPGEISLFGHRVKLPAGGSQGATQVGPLDCRGIVLATESASGLRQLGQAFTQSYALGFKSDRACVEVLDPLELAHGQSGELLPE